MHPKKGVILAKIESTYGVDAVPTAGANAHLVYEPKYELIGEKKVRDPYIPWYGQYGGVNVYEGQKLSFSVEIKGSGTAGVAPRLGTLLRACNMSEIIIPSTAVNYALLSVQSTAESVTIYYYLDGKLYKILGARGTFKFDLTVNEICKIDFEFTGLYATPSIVSLPIPVFSSVAPIVFAGADLDYEGDLPIVQKISTDIGNVVNKRPNPNNARGVSEYFIGGREVKGSFDPEITPSTDFWNIFKNTAQGDLSFRVGTSIGSGNSVTFYLNDLIFETPALGERENILIQEVNFSAHPSAAGNDELIITFT